MAKSKRQGAVDLAALVGSAVARGEGEPDEVVDEGAALRLVRGDGAPRLSLRQLRFSRDQQPRDMLDGETWARLEAEGRLDPASVLAALQTEAHAGRAGSEEVLAHVEELHQSIRSVGVLVPLSLAPGDDYVVLDGHCRAMGAVLAGLADVPVRRDSAENALEAASHRFLLNYTQKRLSPLESMREILRIRALAEAVVAERFASQVDAGEAEGDSLELDPDPLPSRRGRTRAKQMERAVQEIVLQKTGLKEERYQDFYRLRHLDPEAQALAENVYLRKLTLGHLVAIVAAPTVAHAALVRLVGDTAASVERARAYAAEAREYGADYIEQLRRRLVRRKERAKPLRGSWQRLLLVFPDNVTKRISALRLNIEAMSPTERGPAVESIQERLKSLRELVYALEEIVTVYGDTPRSERTDDADQTRP